LVEERLKQVVVLAIDQGDLDGCLGEPFAAVRPPNPAPTMTTCGRPATLPRDTSLNRVESDA
jgi:hypothetical protein